ncbi:MAG: reverse transcriptase-like protein [Plesiomonas sp.]
MRARLSPARVQSLLNCLRLFKTGRFVHVQLCFKLTGLMAAASPVLQLGLLRMRPFQWWMKSVKISPREHPHRRVLVSRRTSRTLRPWLNSHWLHRGVPLQLCFRRETVTTDASLTGLGAVCQGHPTSGVWSGEQRSWHINRLEMLAVFLALKHFLPLLRGSHMIIRTDNTTVISYLNHQRALRSGLLHNLSSRLLLWLQNKILSVKAVHIPGHLNVAADLLSRQGLEPGAWRLNPQTVELIWEKFGRAEVDIFASSTTTHCPLWFF